MKGGVALIGMPGSGKTTFGRALARALDWPFTDMDQWIEQSARRSIPELFAQGEEVFRDAESAAVRALAGQKRVLACGGGVVLRPENVRALRAGGLVLMIDRPIERIYEDIDISARPLLNKGRERLLLLKEQRDALYRTSAHRVILNDQDPERTIGALLEAVREWERER